MFAINIRISVVTIFDVVLDVAFRSAIGIVYSIVATVVIFFLVDYSIAIFIIVFVVHVTDIVLAVNLMFMVVVFYMLSKLAFLDSLL